MLNYTGGQKSSIFFTRERYCRHSLRPNVVYAVLGPKGSKRFECLKEFSSLLFTLTFFADGLLINGRFNFGTQFVSTVVYDVRVSTKNECLT